MAKKKITYQNEIIELDSNTGEVVRNISSTNTMVEQEPPYVKLYVRTVLGYLGQDLTLSPYLIAFAKDMGYANAPNEEARLTIRTDEFVRKRVAREVGVTDRQVLNAINRLVKAEIFIPVELDGKRKRGIYFVNPWVLAKGEWKDISKLQMSIEFKSGAAAVMSVDKNGNSKGLLSRAPREDGQFMLEGFDDKE